MQHPRALSRPRSHLRPLLLACGVTAAAAASPAVATGQQAPAAAQRRARVVVADRPSQISAAPNSFVIGNAYQGRTEVLIGQPVRGTGPGHHGTPWYRLAAVGGGFDHCGWLQSGTWSRGHGRRVVTECRTAWSSPAEPGYLGWFKRTFTNGHIGGGAGDGAPVTFDSRNPGCPGPEGYGNVQPWRSHHESGRNALRMPMAGATTPVLWRYVSRSGQYAMVQGPHGAGQPNWYFVARSCLPRTL